MTNTIAFIGAGNMAGALIGGLLRDGYPAANLIATDTDEQKREHLAASGIQTTDSNSEAVKNADIVVLAVKPQVLPQVCEDISAAVQQRQPLVISIAAGIREASLEQWLGENTALVRCMPNTPAMIQAGASVLHANAHASDTQKDNAESILRSVGITRWLDDESQIDATTALSGSGPAYYFLFMEAMEKAAIDLGLPQETAHLLTLQTALGAARMAMESDDSPHELRAKVTSPGGTTEAAITHMAENQLPEIIARAMQQAQARSVELSEKTDN